MAQLIWNGQAAHASTPETGNNAITGLLQLLADQPGFSSCKALSALFPHGCTDGSGLGIACSDETSGALTCICSQMQIQNGILTGMMDIRYPLCTTKEGIFQIVQERLQTAGFVCEIVIQNDPHAVPEESDFVQTLLRIYETETGEKANVLPSAVAHMSMIFRAVWHSEQNFRDGIIICTVTMSLYQLHT